MQRYHPALLWAGLAMAFSPTLTNLVTSIATERFYAYTLLAWLLLLLLVLRPAEAGSGSPRRGWGGILMVAGALGQLLGAATDSWTIARMGLPLAILGLGVALGRPSVPTLLLGFGVVPLPGFVLNLGSPTLESGLGALAGRVFAALGVPLLVGGPLLESADRRFELVSTDCGLVTAVCCAELLWYRGVRAGRAPRSLFARAALGSAAGLALLQPVLVMVAVASLPLGRPGIGRFLLDHGVPIALGLAALADEARTRWARRAAPEPPA